MRGITLRLKGIFKLFKSRTSKLTTSSSMPSSGTNHEQTRSEIVTCQSTIDTSSRPHSPTLSQTPSLTDSETDGSSISSAEDSDYHDVDTDVESKAVAAGALIAFGHDLSDSNLIPLYDLQNRSSQEASIRVDGASSVPVSWAMDDAEPECSEGMTLLKRSKCSTDLPSMAYNECLGYSDPAHEALQPYRQIGLEIIADSWYPEAVPHIVITLADHNAEELEEIIKNNCAGPQQWWNLAVPPFFGVTCRMPTYEEYVEMYLAAMAMRMTDEYSNSDSQDDTSSEASVGLPETPTEPEQADRGCIVSPADQIEEADITSAYEDQDHGIQDIIPVEAQMDSSRKFFFDTDCDTESLPDLDDPFYASFS